MTIDQAYDACKAAHIAKIAAETALADAKTALANAQDVCESLFLGDERPLTDAEEVRSRAYGEREALVRHEDAVRASLVRENRGTGFDRGGW